MSTWIKEVTIRGMRKVDNATYSFTPQSNYILGNNGTGKSTILNAIQLAILGYIPGQSKKKKDIMANANGNHLEVSCTLVTPEGDVVLTRAWTVIKSTVTGGNLEVSPDVDIEQFISEVELPIFNFNELCSMSANAQKDYFIQLMKDFSSTDLDVMRAIETKLGQLSIPDTWLQDNKEEFLQQLKQCWNTIVDREEPLNEAIASFNAQLKSKLSVEKESVKRSEKFLQELIHYDDVDVAESEEVVLAKIKDIKDQLAANQIYQQAWNRHQSLLKRMATYSEFEGLSSLEDSPEFSQIKDDIESTQRKYDEASKKYRELSDALKLKRDKINQYELQLAEWNTVIESKGVCPYSKETCKTISTEIEKLAKKYETLHAEVSKLTAETRKLEEEWQNCNDVSMQSYHAHGVAESALSRLKAQWEAYQSLKSETDDIPKDPGYDEDQLNAQLAQYETTLDKIRKNQVYEELYSSGVAQKSTSEMTIEVLKELVKLTGANGLQASSANAGFDALKSSITKYLKEFLGSDVTADMCLQQTSNSFSFGISRDGKYIPYANLSTGEQCLYMLAFACAIFEYSNTPLRVILLDDMLDHLDSSNITNAFEAMKSIPGVQFICAGVINCTVKDTFVITI